MKKNQTNSEETSTTNILDEYITRCAQLGDRLYRIRKVFEEEINISMVTHNGEFVITDIETVRGARLKHKLGFDPDSDYETEEPNKSPEERGIL